MTSVQRRNRITGLIMVAVVAFVVFAFLSRVGVLAIGGLVDGPSYTVHFPVKTGVQNLKAGATVHVVQMPGGRVTDVRPVVDGDRPVSVIAVDFTLDDAFELFGGAEIGVVASALGQTALLDIRGIGDPGVPLPADRTFAASTAGRAARVFAGHANARRLTTVVETTTELIERFEELGEPYEAMLRSAADDYESTRAAFGPLFDEARALREQVTTDAEAWDDAHDLSGWSTLGTRMHDFSRVAAELDVELRNERRDHRERIDAITERLRTLWSETGPALAEEITEERALLDELVRRGDTAAGTARAIRDVLRTDAASWTGELEAASGDFAHFQQQLARTYAEVIPFGLLRALPPAGPHPTPIEVRDETLRAFALATLDLEAAVRSARRALDTHAETLVDEPEITGLLERTLDQPREAYDRARQRLWDLLVLERDASEN